MGLTEPYKPQVDDPVHCRGKTTYRRYSGKVLAVFDEPVVVIETDDGRHVIVVEADFDWLYATGVSRT